MKILATGLSRATGEPLVEPIDAAVFGEQVRQGLERNADDLRERAKATSQGAVYRREVELGPVVDVRDPRAAGWTFLVNADDPDRDALVDAVRPLAEHRRMPDPSKPLQFRMGDDWFEWLLENYSSLDMSAVPHYVLTLGGPDLVPFQFQALLDAAASVGRVQLTPDELRAYADKLIRLESAPDPVPEKRAVVFAPDYGMRPDGQFDATYFSREYMAKPLDGYVRDKLGFETVAFLGEPAVKSALVEALGGAPAALAYTASHGLGAPDQTLEVQQRMNGAICCQRSATDTGTRDWLFSAEDVPDEPFLEGGVLFQFACFGYGTPAESDFMHWLGEPELNGTADFVAALPKRLLAHPRGPVAFIGHVDTAWLHGFDDPDDPHIVEPWNQRMSPFVQAVNSLLRVEPVGRALTDMNTRYSATNAILTGTWDRIRRGKVEETPEFWTRLATTFITRSDAQNYMLFGDPGARIRIAGD